MEAKECLDLWQGLMEEKMEVMKQHRVFKLVPQLKDQHVVGSRWVYANKYDVGGEII